MSPAVSPERWRQIEDLFALAVELPADERGAFLSVRCGDDGALVAEVAALLASATTSAGAQLRGVVHAAAEAVAFAAHVHLPEVAADAYALGDEIARGGMGRIRAARDLRIGRPVAVKELLDRSPALAARFEREARLTARLQHPGIVPIYEIGRWPDGTPFYVMRNVPGRTLRDAIHEARTLPERLALLPAVITAAGAVAYAHGERVVHRDLTPANVLVGTHGETVVIDWGLAKELGGGDEPGGADPAHGDGLTTVVGSVFGTPAYMPPEQARGEPVDTRADVYALGAILHHTLGGSPAYDGGAAEVLARLRAAPARPPGLDATVPGDLRSIVEKAMASDPAARYPSARELVAELARFQAGRLVQAHEYSVRELLGRWVRRHRALVAALAVVLLAGGLGLRSALLARRAEARAAERARLSHELGVETEAMEWSLRAARMLPLHDLRPDEQRARDRLADLRARLTGGPEDALIHDALGRGLLALDDFPAARVELEHAMDLGADGSEVRWSLAYARVRMFETQLAELHRMGGPSWVQARRGALEVDLVAPARLLVAGIEGWHPGRPHLLEGLFAYAAGDLDAGLTEARSAAEAAPLDYAARVLAAEILHERASVAYERRDAVAATGFYVAAIAEYERAAAIGRSDASVHAGIAEEWLRFMELVAWMGGDPGPMLGTALAAADRAVTAAPDRSAGYRRKAFAYLMGAEHSLFTVSTIEGWDRCIAAARAAVAVDPGDFMSHEVVGTCEELRASVYLGDPETRPRIARAIQSLLAALRLSPGFPWAVNDLGLTYKVLAYLQAMNGAPATALGRLALEQFERASRLDPEYQHARENEVELLGSLQEWRVERGEWDPALEARFRELRPTFGDDFLPRINSSYMLLARLRYQVARGAEAIAPYDEAMALLRPTAKLLPDSAEVAGLIADAELLRAQAEGRPGPWLPAARAGAAHCLTSDPRDFRCLLVGIRAAWQADDRSAMAALAERAVAAYPESGRARQALAETRRRLGDVDGGRAEIARALALAPSLAEAHVTSARLEGRDPAAAARALVALETAAVLDPLLRPGLEAERRRALARVAP